MPSCCLLSAPRPRPQDPSPRGLGKRDEGRIEGREVPRSTERRIFSGVKALSKYHLSEFDRRAWGDRRTPQLCVPDARADIFRDEELGKCGWVLWNTLSDQAMSVTDLARATGFSWNTASALLHRSRSVGLGESHDWGVGQRTSRSSRSCSASGAGRCVRAGRRTRPGQAQAVLPGQRDRAPRQRAGCLRPGALEPSAGGAWTVNQAPPSRTHPPRTSGGNPTRCGPSQPWQSEPRPRSPAGATNVCALGLVVVRYAPEGSSPGRPWRGGPCQT